MTTTLRLDDPAQRALATLNPSGMITGPPPMLIDEWQYVPAVWDAVRRAVDADPTPNRFLLAGSAVASNSPMRSGAGRIPSVRMHPMSLVAADERAQRAQLKGYVDRIVDREFSEQGHVVRRPATLNRWLCAYAAATSTTSTLETIRDAASARGGAPARPTVESYRETLQRLWIIEELPGWSSSNYRLGRLGRLPKLHLADPALAATLLGVGERRLMAGARSNPLIVRDLPLLGQLFESLVALSLRTYAQSVEAGLFHFRDVDGRHEVDFVLEGRDGRVLAIEVKLNPATSDDDVAHLLWLERRLGREQIADLVVINTGRYAYRRKDGVAVVPAALLGP